MTQIESEPMGHKLSINWWHAAYPKDHFWDWQDSETQLKSGTGRLTHRSSLDAYHLFERTYTHHLGRNQSRGEGEGTSQAGSKALQAVWRRQYRPEQWKSFENFMRQNYNNNNQRQGDDTKQQQQDMTIQQLDMQYETKVWTLGRGVTCNDKFLVRNWGSGN